MAASCTSRRPVSFFSRAASFLARSRLAKSVSRILAKAHTTKMLICTARGLLRIFAAIRAPYSVKA